MSAPPDRRPRASQLWRRLRDLPPWYWTVCALVTLAALSAMALLLHEAERRDEAAAAQTRRNLARSLGEHQESSLRAIDIFLQSLRESWLRDRRGFAAAVERQEQMLRGERLIQVAVVDGEGWLVFSRQPWAAAVNFADREYFREHRQSGRDQLLISEPLLGRITGTWAIQLSRPILDRAQRFRGLIVVALPVPALELVYDDIALGSGTIIALARADGRLLARSGDIDKAAGASFAGMRGLDPGDSPTGEFVRPAPLDGVERIFSYRRLRSYPLTVYVGDEAAALRRAQRQERALALGALALGLLLVFAISALLIDRGLERERAAATEARLQTEMRESEQRHFDERERMMLELHDGSIQSLYGTGLQLEEARALASRDPAAAARLVAEAEARLNLVIQELRQFLTGEAPRPYSAPEFLAEVHNLVKAHASRLHETRLILEPAALERLSRAQATHVLRIIGETMSNVARHSSAQRADIGLALRDGSFLLEVSDDGAGLGHGEDESGGGLGLHHVRVRAQQLGGQATIESARGKGTHIRVRFPAAPPA